MQINDNVKDFYEEDSPQYDTRWKSQGGAETTKRQIKIVEELTHNWNNKKIVEIGCGSGNSHLI